MDGERQPLLRFADSSAFLAAAPTNVQGDVEDPLILRNSDGTSPDTGRKAPRLASLDMFRGLTMVGMILVKNQGSFTDVLEPFQESAWEGLRLADAVFPCFLFIAGLAISLSMRPLFPRIHKNSTIWIWIRVVRRIVLLFAIGVLFNFIIMLCAQGWHRVKAFRIMGVLQRVSLCYGVVALSYLLTPVWSQRLLMLLCAVGYLIPMYVIDVPAHSFPDPYYNETLPPYACGQGKITPECNVAAYIDQKVFGNKLMELPNDPDGLFSTLSAIVTTFIGLEFGRVIRLYKGQHEHVLGRSVFLSMSCLVLGIFISFWMPFVKGCWTLSFALAAAGIAGIAQSIAYYAVDVAQWKDNPALHVCVSIAELIIQPLVWIGMNPITIFVLMIAVEIVGQNAVNRLPVVGPTVPPGQLHYTLWQWVFEKGFHSWISSAQLASLIFAFGHLILWTLVAWVLYVVGVFIRL